MLVGALLIDLPADLFGVNGHVVPPGNACRSSVTPPLGMPQRKVIENNPRGTNITYARDELPSHGRGLIQIATCGEDAVQVGACQPHVVAGSECRSR